MKNLRIALLLALMAGSLAWRPAHANASVKSAVYAAASSGTITLSLTGVSSGDLILIFSTSGNSGPPYVTSISDSFSSSLQTSVYGTFGSSSSFYGSGSFGVSAFYGYASGSGSDTITVTWSASHSGQYGWAVDCGGIAASSPLISNIVNYQSSVSAGTNVVSVAGGTGSDSVSTVPALVVGFAVNPVGALPWSAGTSPVSWSLNLGTPSGIGGLESYRFTSSGTIDATFSFSSGSGNIYSWQIALKEAAGGGCHSCFFF